MRVSREKAAESRERIVEVAARQFRERGFDGVGIDAIMREAGLTHGGFYGHFDSKEALAAAALAQALQHGAAWQRAHPDLAALVDDYLSERHCAGRGDGCAIAALGGDIARQGPAVRGLLTRHIRTQLDRLAALFRSGGATRRRQRAIATLSGLVGALILARAVDDPALSAEILAAARTALGGAHGARGPAG